VAGLSGERFRVNAECAEKVSSCRVMANGREIAAAVGFVSADFQRQK